MGPSESAVADVDTVSGIGEVDDPDAEPKGLEMADCRILEALSAVGMVSGPAIAFGRPCGMCGRL